MHSSVRRPALVFATVLLLGLAGCGGTGSDSTPDAATPTQVTVTDQIHVVAISVDGLNPTALTQLGRAELPSFWRLISRGASTFNARTEVERTDTLPNHTGMMTGRRVDAATGGHGVYFNDSVSGTIAEKTGVASASVFDVVGAAGLTSALFASKSKFDVYDRSWPSISRYTFESDNHTLTDQVSDDLGTNARAFTFVHLSAPDVAGHAHTWMSQQYLDAVREVDADLGEILDTIEATPALAEHTVVLLTADHGGNPHVGLHTLPDDPDNYTIPFIAWGAGVAVGTDLYAVNPQRTDPGTSRPAYGLKGPIRNGDIANAALHLLGLGPVPGSEFGVTDPVLVR